MNVPVAAQFYVHWPAYVVSIAHLVTGTAHPGNEKIRKPVDKRLACGLSPEVKMINIRKLAAVDMAWLGPRVIVTEYALGVVLPLILGVLSIRSGLFRPVHSNWQAVMGIWLVGIAANYIPLFIYAVLIARAGTVKEEGQPELVRARRYGVQQVIILVPLLVVVVALMQERRRE